jgi:plastocyanin
VTTLIARCARVSAASLAAAVLVLMLVSCGSAENGSAATTIAEPTTVEVRISDGAFDPRQVEVAVGGSVTWINDDGTTHQLLSLEPNVIDSPPIGKAGAYTARFTKPGEYRYYCSIHNSMKGVVVVR